MVSPEFGMKIMRGVLELAGTFISSQFGPDTTALMEKNLDKYYTQAMAAAKKKQRELSDEPISREKIRETIERAIPSKTMEKIKIKTDFTKEKIEEGVACLSCGKQHLSTVSAMLNEAYRMVKSRNMSDYEIQRRIGIASDEIAAAERGDLHADQLEKLPPHERRIAEELLKELRELRHNIDAMINAEDLGRVAAKASKIRTKAFKQIFELATADGTISKLCEGLDGKEKQKCMATIGTVLSKEHEQEKESEQREETDENE
jgi:hypothetical protein